MYWLPASVLNRNRFNTDRGSVYTSAHYRGLVKGGLVCVPRWAEPVCWNNAMAELFFSALKNERVHRTVYATKTQARREVIDYVEGFHNTRRRHTALDYKRPNDVHYGYTRAAIAA